MVDARVASLAAIVAVALMGCQKECTVYKTMVNEHAAPIEPPNYKELKARTVSGGLTTWMANNYQPKSACADIQPPPKTPPATCYGIEAATNGMGVRVTFQLETFDPEVLVDNAYPGFIGLDVNLTMTMGGDQITILMPCKSIPFTLASDKTTIDVDLIHGGTMVDINPTSPTYGETIEGCLNYFSEALYSLVTLDVQNMTWCSATNEIEGTMTVEIDPQLWPMLEVEGNPPPTTLALPSIYCPGQLHTTTTTTLLVTYECTTKVEGKCCDALGAKTWSETIDAQSVPECAEADIYYTEHGAVCNALPAIGSCKNTADQTLWEGVDTKQCQGHLQQSGKEKPDGPGCVKVGLPPKADKKCLETFFEDNIGYSVPCSTTIAELIACGAKEGLACSSDCFPHSDTIPCSICLQNVMIAKCNPTFQAKSGVGACPAVDYNKYFNKYFNWAAASTGLWELHAVDWKTTVSISGIAATTGAVLVAFVAAVTLRRRWHNWHSTDDGAQAILDTEDVE